MNNKIIFGVLLIVFLMSFSSAEFLSTVKTKLSPDYVTDSGAREYPQIVIKDLLGLGKDLATITLTKHDKTCGESCLSEFTIVTEQDGALIDDIKFYTLSSDGVVYKNPVEQPIRNYQINYWGYIIDYEIQCKEINGNNNTCYNVQSGGHYGWINYNLGEELPSGTYNIQLNGNKRPSRSVDWIIKTQGKIIENLAVWSGINYIYDEINDSSINTNLWSISGTSSPTEDTSKITGSTGCGDTECLSDSKLVSTNLSQYIDNGINFTIRIALNRNHGNSNGGTLAISNFSFLGTLVYDSAISGDDDSIWTFIKNNSISNKTYSVYNDGVWLKNIDYTSNKEITLYAISTGVGSSGGSNTADFSIYYVYFSLPNIILLYPSSNQILTTNLVTTNATITVSGETFMHLMNVTLWDNSSGSWAARNITTSTSNSIIAYDATQVSYGTDNTPTLKKTITLNNANVTNATSLGMRDGDSAGSTISYKWFYANGSNSGLIPQVVSTSWGLYTWNNPAPSQLITKIEIYLARSTSNGVCYEKETTVYGPTRNTTQSFVNTYPVSSYIWNIQSCDSDGACGFGVTNGTFSIDAAAPTIEINYGDGIQNYGIINVNHTINYTITDQNLESCWLSYGGTNKTISCTSGQINTTNFTLQYGVYNAKIYANDSVSNLAIKDINWSYKIFENSRTGNTTSYETAYENYAINLTANSSLTNVYLSYGGTEYSTIYSGGLWYYSRDLSSSNIGNNTIFYRMVYDGTNINSINSYQNVSYLYFTLCNATYSTPFLNITFKDENTLSLINGTIQTSTWNYYLGSGLESKNYTYTTANVYYNYTFCSSATDRTIHVNPYVNYLGDSYPNRIYQPGLLTLTNSTTQTILYLLNSIDGIYVTFITSSSSNTVISNVDVLITRLISGIVTAVSQGQTDSAGSFTAWLNPNYDHTITATKSGYSSNIQTIRPTQSTYTLTMSSGLSNYTYVSSYDGLKWFVFPSVGIRNNNSISNFGFNISARNSNILKCKIELLNNDKSIVLSTAETTVTNGSQCSVQTSYTITSTYPKVKGRLLIDVGEGYQLLEEDAYWNFLQVNSSGLTFTDWFQGLSTFDLSYFNNDEQHREYSQILIFFLVVMIICAALNAAGWDIQTQGGMIFLVLVFVWGASIPGFLNLNYISPFAWMDQYFLAIVYTMFCIGFAVREFT